MLEPPHWFVKYAKSHVFNAFDAPPHRKTAPPQTFEFPNLAEKSVSILTKTFFFFGDHLILGGKKLRISDFGRKIRLNFGEDLFFFGDHLILGGKKLGILDFGRKISLNFGEEPFFCFCFWRPPDFGRKKAWNFGFRPKNQSQFRRRPFFLFLFLETT